MSLGTRIARIVASKALGKDSQMVNIKKDLTKFPGIRLEYRGMEHASGEMAHIFHLYIPKGTEPRYSQLFAMIGDKFYQGNQFVIYRWIPRDQPTPKPVKAIGYKNNISTWSCPLDPSIQVLRYKKRS